MMLIVHGTQSAALEEARARGITIEEVKRAGPDDVVLFAPRAFLQEAERWFQEPAPSGQIPSGSLLWYR